MSDMQGQRRELEEAVYAGNQAMEALNEAEKLLSDARGLGVWDLLGGGFLSSMLKHSRMDDARQAMERAQAALRSFDRELRDVAQYTELSLDSGGLLQFFDVFCDNFFADLMVQSQIRDALSNLRSVKQRLEQVLQNLERML